MSVAGGTFDHICKQLEAELLLTRKGGGGGVSNSQIQSMRCILEEAAESVHAHEEATRSGGGDGGDGALSFDGAVEFLLAYAGCSSTSNNTDDGGRNEEEEESELLFTLFTTSMTGSRRVRDHDRRLKTLLFCLNIPFEEIDVSDNKYLQKKLGDAIVECAQSYGSSSRNGGGGSALLAASPRVYRYCHTALNDDDVGTASIAAQQPSSNDEEGEFPTLAKISAVLSSQHAVGSAVTSTAMRYGLPVVFVKRQDGRGTSGDGVQQSSPYGAYLGTYAELQMMVDEQDYTPGGEEEDEEDENNNNSSRFYNTNPEIDVPTPNITTTTTTTTTPSISKPSLLAQVIQDYARNQK